METTVDELKTFIAIIDSGSITSAAELMEQTTSGVSRTLSRLEKKLTTTLLRRTTRKIDLTMEGEVFLKHARAILEAFELAEESVRIKNRTPSGLIRVDSASPFVLQVIVPHLGEFHRLYPEIRIELYSSDRIIDLLERRIDVAIRIGKLDDSTPHASRLGRSRLRILASPEYLEAQGVPKSGDDLAKHRLLGFTAPRELNHWPLKSKLGSSYPANLFAAASSGETVLQMARRGLGIACLSDFMTHVDISKGSLVQILKNQTVESNQEISAVYYKNSLLSERTSIFVDFLKKKMKFLD